MDDFEFFLKHELWARYPDGTEHPVRELDERKPDEARLIRKYSKKQSS